MAQEASALGGSEAGAAPSWRVRSPSDGDGASPAPLRASGWDAAGRADLLRLLQEVADRVRGAVGVDGCAVWLAERGKDGPLLTAASGSLSDRDGPQRALGRPSPAQPRLLDVDAEAPGPSDKLIVTVPLPADEWHTGGVVLEVRDPRRVRSPQDMECVRALGQYALAAAGKAKLVARARAAERLTRSIISTSPNPIICDTGLHVTGFNESASRLTGRPARDVIGAGALTLYPPSAMAYVREVMVAATTHGGAAAFETQIRAADGECAPVLLCVCALRDDGGRPEAIVTVIEDLRASRRLHERLLRAERLRALGQVASGVAHDLNNVLAAVLARAELLQYESDGDKIQHGLAVIAQAAEDGARVVERIRDFGRNGDHRAHVTVNLSDVVRSAVEFTEPRWGLRGPAGRPLVHLDCRLADHAFVCGSASELRIVFCNLIDNAVAAMPSGGTVTVATEARDGRVQASVADTGEGMGPEAQLRAFDPFFTTKGAAGTGLGLWEAQEIARRHGGSIAFVSAPGEGTTFTVDLPGAPSPSAEEKGEIPAVHGPQRPCRILAIDDDPQVLETLVEVLASEGHEVTRAQSGAEGLSVFSKGEFDVVITDLGMPYVSGWDVARAVKQQRPEVPVAIVTGWGMQGDEPGLEDPVDARITKPFRLADLLDTVRALGSAGRVPPSASAPPATAAPAPRSVRASAE